MKTKVEQEDWLRKLGIKAHLVSLVEKLLTEQDKDTVSKKTLAKYCKNHFEELSNQKKLKPQKENLFARSTVKPISDAKKSKIGTFEGNSTG